MDSLLYNAARSVVNFLLANLLSSFASSSFQNLSIVSIAFAVEVCLDL